ncbi:MAG: hypothetical protein IH624_13780 [Phycisphaerae bacterium]|nr:hypothetical protein [Phycisphaerae bacterium]
MPKVLDILKTRWAEVLLLVGFQTGVLFLLEQIMAMSDRQREGTPVQMPEHVAFLLGLGTMAFIIVWQMLYLGFLRTAYVDGCERWEPQQLLRIGRYYFWRVVRFQLLLVIVYSILSMIAVSIVNSIIKPAAPEDVPVWATMLALFAVSMVLIKPAALSLPIMVAHDVLAFQSIAALRHYRLLEQWAIPVLYAAVLIFSAAVSTADAAFTPAGTLHYAMMAFHNVVLSVMLLAVHLAALRLIKSHEPPAAIEVEEEPADDDTGPGQ